MARPELSRAFEHMSLPHGDDGKVVRGIIARCGSPGCAVAIPLPVNTMSRGYNETEEVEWKFIARKLEAKGWQIGRRYQDHRCPALPAQRRACKAGQRDGRPIEDREGQHDDECDCEAAAEVCGPRAQGDDA